MNSMNPFQSVIVTGAAGFIGYHLSKRLLQQGVKVIGIDNLNPYYDVNLKKDRLSQLTLFNNFKCSHANLENRHQLEALFKENAVDVVVNLAAQAGVRYSLTNPHAYVDSNIVGFVNILECCRHYGVNRT